jgi:uncharacterized protein with HEPN domain
MKQDKPTSQERIEQILESVQNIQKFTDGYSFRDFEKDMKTYYACLYQYAVIGEAAGRIDSEILQKYDYPWYKVKSFSNFILHEYHAIDARVVWDTTRIILPGLKDVIEKILEREF